MKSVLERQHRISDTGAETLEPDSRLVFAPSPTAQGVVDGSWWPRTRDPAAELPALIAAVTDRLGMVNRIALNADAWDTRPRQITTVDQQVVRLDWPDASDNAREAEMDIVMTGRNVDVPAHYRAHVTDKLAHLQRFNSHPIRYDVELDHENNPRQSKTCQRVEITSTGNGPTMRAEASGPDFYTALDAAVGKLEARLRRSHDRRRVHHGRHQPTSVATATAPLATALPTDPTAAQHTTTSPSG